MIRAMIFDLDGMLVKTEQLKALSYVRAIAELRQDGADELSVMEAFKAFVGLSRREVALGLMERFGIESAAQARMSEFNVDTPWQAFVHLRLRHHEHLLSDPNVLLSNQWPHKVGLLREARRSGCKVGLATMSHCPEVQRVLGILNLQDAFDFIASREDVECGKPDPEIYLLVANELGVSPSECMVIEDSPTGVKAALAAGMRCVAVSTPFTRETLHQQKLLPEKHIVDDPGQLMDAVRHVMFEHNEPSTLQTYT